MSAEQHNLVVMGVFGAAHGLKGELRLKSYTADPVAIAGYKGLQMKSGQPVRLLSVRPQKDMLIVCVEGVTDRSSAEKLVNQQLFVSRDALGTPQDEDEFFHADLIGLAARTADGQELGTVTGLFDFGAGDIVEVTAPGAKPILLPFTKSVVPVISITDGYMIVTVPDETGSAAERQADEP